MNDIVVTNAVAVAGLVVCVQVLKIENGTIFRFAIWTIEFWNISGMMVFKMFAQHCRRLIVVVVFAAVMLVLMMMRRLVAIVTIVGRYNGDIFLFHRQSNSSTTSAASQISGTATNNNTDTGTNTDADTAATI